jgi:hypothetical protein
MSGLRAGGKRGVKVGGVVDYFLVSYRKLGSGYQAGRGAALHPYRACRTGQTRPDNPSPLACDAPGWHGGHPYHDRLPKYIAKLDKMHYHVCMSTTQGGTPMIRHCAYCGMTMAWHEPSQSWQAVADDQCTSETGRHSITRD